MGDLRYWVCQVCKQGQVDDEKPTKCLNCGEVGGAWKSTPASNMGSFRTYKCTHCDHTVEERQPPRYPCSWCGSNSWKVFHGYDNEW